LSGLRLSHLSLIQSFTVIVAWHRACLSEGRDVTN
jgi:hypothetical protein